MHKNYIIANKKHNIARIHIFLQEEREFWLIFYPSNYNFTQPLVLRFYLLSSMTPYPPLFFFNASLKDCNHVGASKTLEE